MAHYDDVGTAGPGDPASGPTMRECVKLLLVRFPHISPVTFRRLQMQETFRELCEEYVACARSVERLNRTGTDDALRAEYGALSLRLEGEMLRYIAEHGGTRSP